MIDTLDDDTLIEPTEERLGADALVAVIINFDSDGIDEYDEMVSVFVGRGSYSDTLMKLYLDLKNRETPPDCLSIKETPLLEFTSIPSYLRYVFLRGNNTMSVIIAIDFLDTQAKALISIFQRFNEPLVGILQILFGFHPEFIARIEVCASH